MTATHTVSRPRALALSYRVLRREIVNRGRLVSLGLLGAVMIVVGWAIGASEGSSDSRYGELGDTVSLVSGLGLAVIVPVVSLVFASAALGDTREDGTLVYLWLRPMDRSPVVLGAYGAALTVVLPLTVVPVAVGAALAGGGNNVVGASVLASLVGALAYSAVFTLLGLVLKRPIVWGLAYVLIWEGISAALGTAAARLAVRGYTRSILTRVTEVDLDELEVSVTVGVVVPVLIVVGALALAAIRLNRLDVA